MKKSLLLLGFLLFASTLLKADYGNCVVYQARFYLKNGRTVMGYFEAKFDPEYCELNARGTNKWCTDAGVFEVYKKVYNSSNPHPKVYKKISYVTPKSLRKPQPLSSDTYRYVHPEDILDIPAEQIRKMTFLSAAYAQGNWLTAGFIVGSAGMLDTIQRLHYWQLASLLLASVDQKTILTFLPDSVANDLDRECYNIFNYNSRVNMAEIKRLVTLKLSYNRDALYDEFRDKHHVAKDRHCPDDLRRQFNTEMENREKAALQWLMQRGIVLVRVWDTC